MPSKIINLFVQVEVSDDENNSKLTEKLDNLLDDMKELAIQQDFDIYDTTWEDM